MTINYPNKPEFDLDGVTVISAVDWLGNRFGLGDLVVYCIGAGRGQMMAIGQVQKFKLVSTPYYYSRYSHEFDEEDQKRYEKQWGHRFEPYCTVTVLTLRTSGHWDNEKRTRASTPNEMNMTAIRGFEEAIGVLFP